MRTLRRLAPLVVAACCFAAPLSAADAPPAPPTPPAAPAPPPAPPELTTQKLGDRLWRLAGVEAGGVLVLEGKDGLLIVDAQDSSTATQLDAALAKLSRRPVTTVINTHYHGDHTWGNTRYRARGARVIAHRNVTVQALKDTTVEAMGWHRKPLDRGGLPTQSFDDSLRLRVNGEDIVLYHPIDAHTDGDAILWFPKRNLIHTGDIVEVGAPPFIDWWAGGTLDGMIAAVDFIAARCDERTLVVPGHGDVVDKAWLAGYRALLVAAGESARAAIAKGQSLKDYGDSRPLAEYAERLGSERRARRLAVQTYYGLKGFKE